MGKVWKEKDTTWKLRWGRKESLSERKRTIFLTGCFLFLFICAKPRGSCLQWYFSACGQLSGSCNEAHSAKAHDNVSTGSISEPWPLLDTLEHPDSWKNEFQDKHNWLETNYWYYIWYTSKTNSLKKYGSVCWCSIHNMFPGCNIWLKRRN